MSIHLHKYTLSFSKKLFLTVILLFIAFIICFSSYQYHREKEYKIELLHTQLQDYNLRLYEELNEYKEFNDSIINQYLSRHNLKDLRITLIAPTGDVIYESQVPDTRLLVNHLNRKEVQIALKKGSGFDVRRTSETTGTPYFYSATFFKRFIIRSALPYNINLIKNLEADFHYLWFTAAVSFILIWIFYKLTRKLGTSITQLQIFAKKADKNEPIELDMTADFPHNELGDISQHIIQIYKRLHHTKEALYIEREKLITHLQISREGLGVFTRDKKEILVNSLFTQYMNLISDSNLGKSEDAFKVQEMGPITDFINNALNHPSNTEEKRTSICIDKNGKTFSIECIIFQDLSFEISINDVTLEEEQNRLKRQLTQNIAHELKTPVSSIQGYLETIVTNDYLPADKQKSFLSRCYAQSNRLSRLLRDISMLTRMDEAANMIEMERVDLCNLVKNIINEVNMELEQKHITVHNNIHPGLTIKGNQLSLYSIFRNLMDNSIAYAGTDISIDINCFREDEKFYYFSFADTGTGVPPEHLNRIFERFYRVDKGRSRKLGGTGLGLAIVKNAILMHNGNISAKLNQSGGLEFVFTLSKMG